MNEISHMNLASTIGEFDDIARILPDVIGAILTTATAVTGIAWSFKQWMTEMSQEFAAATLGVFSTLLLASFVELFTSLRKDTEDKAHVEELHHADIARSIAASAAGRTVDSGDASSIQDYADRIEFLKSRHRRHIVWWVALSTMLAVSIGLLLHWSSLKERDRGGIFWNEMFPGIIKAIYVLSIIYFVAAALMRVSLDKHISRWKRRRVLAERFGVPDTDEVFDLEKQWQEQVRRRSNEEERPDTDPGRATPAPTPTQPPNPTAAPRRSRASTQVTPPPEG
ncbi:hypothetical protein ACMA1D_05430 [Streptomyces sp. 796.1]|uniref:hypothetical protein n=1 Tax=Streptomyces sp. 796.1 TaxID=3163029 RepID=UPI0039C90A8F